MEGGCYLLHVLHDNVLFVPLINIFPCCLPALITRPLVVCYIVNDNPTCHITRNDYHFTLLNAMERNRKLYFDFLLYYDMM